MYNLRSMFIEFITLNKNHNVTLISNNEILKYLTKYRIINKNE